MVGSCWYLACLLCATFWQRFLIFWCRRKSAERLIEVFGIYPGETFEEVVEYKQVNVLLCHDHLLEKNRSQFCSKCLDVESCFFGRPSPMDNLSPKNRQIRGTECIGFSFVSARAFCWNNSHKRNIISWETSTRTTDLIPVHFCQ